MILPLTSAAAAVEAVVVAASAAAAAVAAAIVSSLDWLTLSSTRFMTVSSGMAAGHAAGILACLGMRGVGSFSASSSQGYSSEHRR